MKLRQIRQKLNLGIRGRVILLAITPALIISIFIGFYLTDSRNRDLIASLKGRGETTVRHLASSAEFWLFAENTQMLQSLTNSIALEPDIEAVYIYDENMQALAWTPKTSTVLQPRKPLSGFEFQQTVYQTGLRIDEFNELNSISSNIVLGHARIIMSQESLQRQQFVLLRRNIFITLAVFLISIFIAIRISRSITKPVIAMQDAVSHIRSGELETRVENRYTGELKTLVDGINSMASSLQSSQAMLEHKVKSATEKLQDTVSQLETKNQELEEARIKAEKANEVKSVFLANMSHEIRTPINAVLGYTRLLEKTLTSTEQHDYISTVNQAASHLLRIIDDILDFSRLESGNIPLEYREFDLRGSLEDVVAMLSPTAHDKNLELSLLVSSQIKDLLFGDPTRICQVVANLINNAIKFTKSGAIAIRVDVESEEGNTLSVRISVKDTGIGIDSRAQEVLFNSFTQADSSIARQYGGTGLGLAISKQLVTSMGGEINFESEIGKGSCFWFVLPLQIIRGQSQRVSPLLLSKSSLLFDENSFSKQVLKSMLITWNLSVFSANTLQNCYSMLESAPQDSTYDVLIVGLSPSSSKPDISNEILKNIRNHYNGPVIFLIARSTNTSYAKNSDTIKFLSKPVRKDALYRTLLDIFELRIEPSTTSLNNTALKKNYEGKHILIVEDNEFNRELLTNYLQQKGATVIQVANGVEAIKDVENNQYDLIFMDIHMPIMDGIEAAKRLLGVLNKPPIIWLTADVFAVTREKMDECGVADYLLKPISEDMLDSVAQKFFHQSENQIEVLAQDKADIPESLKAKYKFEFQRLLDNLEDAFDRKDQDKATGSIHQIKGLVAHLGKPQLVDQTRDIEQQIHAGELSQSRGSYESLRNDLLSILEDFT